MGMAIDPAGQHQKALGVDDARLRACRKHLADGDDAPVVEKQVSDIVVDGSYDASIANQGRGHGS